MVDKVAFQASPSQVDPPLPLPLLSFPQSTKYLYGYKTLEDLTIPPLPPLPDKFDFTFAELRACGDAMGEKSDCAVIATSVVTGYAYPKVHEMYRILGRRRRCATPWVYTLGVFAQLGLKIQDISKFYDGASIRSIVPQLPEQGKFLVRSRKHVSAVNNGVCEDWADDRKLYVQGIYQVVDIDEPIQSSPPPPRKRTVFVDWSQPTKAVWAIADILMNDYQEIHPAPATPTRRYWSTFRAKVVAECVNNGIHKTTASVQVGKWMAENGLHMGYMA